MSTRLKSSAEKFSGVDVRSLNALLKSTVDAVLLFKSSQKTLLITVDVLLLGPSAVQSRDRRRFALVKFTGRVSRLSHALATTKVQYIRKQINIRCVVFDALKFSISVLRMLTSPGDRTSSLCLFLSLFDCLQHSSLFCSQ
jgi:hypothetical protein